VLFGENGAGKSTIINIIAGTFSPDKGEYLFNGRRMAFPSPHRARTLGISPVFQEFSLVPELTVEQNLFLGREAARGGFLQRRAMRARAQALIERLGFALDPSRKVRQLSRAHQQMAEIAKALLADVKVLILDEPTASLTEAESEKLFAIVEQLRASGVGIIYVSHRMREITRIADRITVLRDGRHIKTVRRGEATDNDLIELMTGRKVEMLYPSIDHRPSGVLLDVRGLTLEDGSVRDVSFVARAGEITGIAGLVGCGKSELVRAVYGLEPIQSGQVQVCGAAHPSPSPAASLRAGVCYFPSDRVREGLALARPIRENASMAALDRPEFSRRGWLRPRSERRTVQGIVQRLQLRPPQIERPVGGLSGGNRQKVLLARGLTRPVKVFLFDEPTVGIDVGAKLEVYEMMKSLVAGGMAVVVVSSELPEVLGLSNRVYVMHRSRMVAELSGGQATEAAVLSHFFPGEAPEACKVPA